MPGWTRYTLRTDRRDRPEPVEPERTDRRRFSGKKFVITMLVLGPPILMMFVIWVSRLGSR